MASWEPVDINPIDRDGWQRTMTSETMARLLKLRQS